MPADSDWESGAESQPQPAAQSQPESDVEAPPVRILEGQAEANLRQLPRHLREFAKFSTSEQLPDGAQVERHEEQERREEATDNAHSSATKKTSIVKTYKVSRLPPSVQGEFPGQFSGGNRGRLYRERSQTARLVSHNIPLELTSNHSSSPDSDSNPGCGSSPAPGSSTQSSIPSLVQSPTPAPPPSIEPLNPSSSTAGGILGTALLLGLSLLTAWNKFS